MPTYSKVKYEGVYPGVDLVYYGNQGQLEYDFVVSPGADAGAIKMAVAGLQGRVPLRLTGNGDLLAKVQGSEVRLHKPVVYQPASTGNGTLATGRVGVDGHYVINSQGQVAFALGGYDRSKPLVIDPALSYTIAWAMNSEVEGVAVDSAGNAYLTGGVCGNFPVTQGAFLTTNAGACNQVNMPVKGNFIGAFFASADAFVTKLNPTGSSLVYSTYLGGSQGYTAAISIAVDALGSAYVTGQSNAFDFPTTPGAFQTGPASQPGSTNGLGGSAFVSKLNPSGSALSYSTFLDDDGANAAYTGSQGMGIAVDASGDAYVTGVTSSNGFPTTPKAWEPACPNSNCNNGNLEIGFAAEFNPTGSQLIYSTYLGYTAGGFGIAVDNLGDAFVAGSAEVLQSSNPYIGFLTTPGGISRLPERMTIHSSPMRNCWKKQKGRH